ncbi:hypothetical protein ACKWTF_014418 [Chironomus riparius]
MDNHINIFDSLPFELLELIFEYLNPDDLKSLLNLCGRTRNVIIASPISMRKLKLTLMENWNQKVPFVRENGEFVKILNFEFCDFDSPEQFREMMKMMRNIEELKLADLHIDAEKMNRKFRKYFIDLEFLRKLDVDNSKSVGKLLRLYLKDLHVDHLRLDFSHFNVTNEFVRLLWHQPWIKTLELSGFDNIIYKSLFSHDISYMITYSLKKLVLNFRITPNENFLKFFKILETLECLEIHKEVEYPEFLNAIFEMDSLRSLTLATHFVTLRNIDFKKIGNSSLTDLTLVTRSQYGIETTINFMIEKFLCLKSLKVINQKTDSSDQMLAFVKLRVENFEVENSKMKFFQNIKFEGLKKLKISQIHSFLKFEDWENFFKLNNQIEELILSDFEVYYVTEMIKIEIDKIIYNLSQILKTLKYFEISQELRYQKPIKLIIKQDEKHKVMMVSDSFIKIFRKEFHMLRKNHKFDVKYIDDDCFQINNKYLVEK